MEHFSAIPVFVAVIESGSFSSAGKRLGITKSAVSKRISQLEEGLGVRLLHRTTRRLSLTEAGEQYYDYAQRALGLAREGEDAITRLQGRPQGTLRINVPMVFGRLHIAPVVPQFLLENPDIKLDMIMEDRMVDLVDGGFDMAIRIGHMPDSSLVQRRLAPCRSVLCASPGYVARHGSPMTPQDLANHNCMTYSYFRGGSEWTFKGPEGPIKIKPSGNYQVNNSEAIRNGLLAGLGICQMPTFIVGPDLVSGTLIPLLEAYPLPLHAIYAVFPQRRFLPAKVKVFIDFLQQQLGGDSPPWDAAPDQA
ncbi:LysR family transcriptional regulator [Hahella sp. CCB-MM4]|uniref:LysR family transcriptional regulator n=1 Tax=Hahella sp. (strain CCB-MM4) TaxID=1926491 RepID=UPI000B9B1E6B|nr:LysR family transcriptional regulator [Hahella sp. CCB-MM4]OZG75206.1 LysR family transcriptional regulator [Hahella sp. CCB-MM4]